MKKRTLRQEADELKNSYFRIVKTCMDYAVGCDFPAKFGLSFLADLPVSDINFCGVSIAGKPVNADMVRAETKSDTRVLLITEHDITLFVHDDVRRNALINRIRTMDAMVPMIFAAERGDLSALTAQIKAGQDPNTDQNAPSLILAAQRGHTKIVETLVAAHADHTANKPTRLFLEAKEFLAKEHKSVESLSVIDGKIACVPIPGIGDGHQIILVGNENLTTAMGMIKQRSPELHDNIKRIELNNRNFVMVVKWLDKSIKLYVYEDSADRDTIRKNITDQVKLASEGNIYFPVIITNPNNLDVIEIIINEQYKNFDKSKELIQQVIEVASEKKPF